jgi:hypothetical protein
MEAEMTTELFWERSVGKLLTPRHAPIFRQTVTTTHEPLPVATPRDSSDGPAKSGFIARLAGILEYWRAARERRILARHAGNRWCDSVERQVNDSLTNFDRRSDPFGGS